MLDDVPNYCYVDENGDATPGEVLRHPNKNLVYIIPPGRPWSPVVLDHLKKYKCQTLRSTDILSNGPFHFPARPPWIYLEGGALYLRGGMSELYQFRNHRNGQTLIVKAMSFQRAMELGMTEALFARCKIPGLFPILDLAHIGDMLYFLMPMADCVVEPTTPGCFTVLKDVAVVLKNIHALGWVHCDVKPSNLLILDGKAYLADPGIAVRKATMLQRVRCSLRFAPPEWLAAYAEKKPVRIMPSADVYSFAMTALTLLNKTYPLGSLSDQELLAACVYGRVHERLKEIARSLGGRWGEVLAQSLARSPDDRPEMAYFLEVLEDRPIARLKHDSRMGAFLD